MIKNIEAKKWIFLAIFAVILFCPLFVAHAQIFEIPCEGTREDPCTFPKLMELFRNVIDFLILLSIPFATIAFAWAGYIVLTSQGNPGGLSQAKDIFWKVLKGFIFILCAWLIVRFITTALLKEGTYEDLLDQGAPSVMREFLPPVREIVFVGHTSA